jgi:hypothetical protein
MLQMLYFCSIQKFDAKSPLNLGQNTQIIPKTCHVFNFQKIPQTLGVMGKFPCHLPQTRRQLRALTCALAGHLLLRLAKG